MAPAAAWFSLGLDPAEFGPRLQTYRKRVVPKMRRTARGVRGAVLYVDKFGNLMTNIPARLALKRGVLKIREREIRNFQTSYTNRKSRNPFVIPNSLGLLEVAVAGGSAARILGAGRGDTVDVLLK
jgi:S-adenosylmethionine hydrolase